ncbi:hypothetical protein VTN77DRAFT_5181 [Rasamsonia byssochlamydoides]|uniref:uncharacterized protein n=1 Tax=Rasamsonia byssochlamydoides TaxID=89139 RepID=UPI0037421011
MAGRRKPVGWLTGLDFYFVRYIQAEQAMSVYFFFVRSSFRVFYYGVDGPSQVNWEVIIWDYISYVPVKYLDIWNLLCPCSLLLQTQSIEFFWSRNGRMDPERSGQVCVSASGLFAPARYILLGAMYRQRGQIPRISSTAEKGGSRQKARQ